MTRSVSHNSHAQRRRNRMLKVNGDCCIIELWELDCGDVRADVLIFDESLNNLMDEHGVSCLHALLELDFELAGIMVTNFECGIPYVFRHDLFDRLLESVDGCAEWLDIKQEWRA